MEQNRKELPDWSGEQNARLHVDPTCMHGLATEWSACSRRENGQWQDAQPALHASASLQPEEWHTQLRACSEARCLVLVREAQQERVEVKV